MNGEATERARQSGKPPRVLIVSTELWISTARLAMALHELGCEIALLSPRSHPALTTQAVREHFTHSPLRPLLALRRTLLRVRPDALIPADERTVLHLQELWDSADAESDEAAWLRDLLVRSLGPREALMASRSRMHVSEIAREQGAPIPETVCVDYEEGLASTAEKLGMPLVLKADMTSGGDGVCIAADLREAQHGWRRLHRPPNLLRALRRGVLFKNWAHLRGWARRETLPITAQRFVIGPERTSMAVCHQGAVLACVCLEVVRTWQVRGPSSVLRLVQDEGMEHTMRSVAGKLKLTGFCGFDFMVEQGTTRALLIEMNPRPTQTSHLALGVGRDLVAAYVREVLGVRNTPDREAVALDGLIALFPQELVRDPNSELVHQAYHDVPWSAPGLVGRVLSPLPELITADARWDGADHPPLPPKKESKSSDQKS